MRTHKVKPLTEDELSVFCSQLSLLLQAGVGSEESLSILTDDARTPGERALLEQIHAALEGGAYLSDALAGAGVFPPYLIRMVEIGQAAGRLDQVLSALSAYYQRESDVSRSLRRAAGYPAVMAVLIAVVFLVLVARVLPVFQQVFDQLGVSVSPAGAVLLQLGGAGKYLAVVLAVLLILCAAFLLWLFRRGKDGTAAYSKLFLKSAASRAIDQSRFSSAMSLMLSSGLPLDEAMDRTCQLLEGTALAPRLQACQAHMQEGLSFPRAVEDAGILSGLEAGLLSAGFRAGASERAMKELSHRCAARADDALSRSLSRFEYGLVAVLCIAVGLVLLSVMLPLLGVLSAIGG